MNGRPRISLSEKGARERKRSIYGAGPTGSSPFAIVLPHAAFAAYTAFTTYAAYAAYATRAAHAASRTLLRGQQFVR